MGLTILHPPVQNGTLYIQSDDTRLLLRVQSRDPTTVSWRGSNHSATFQSECPLDLLSNPALCQLGPNPGSGGVDAEPSQFAVLDLSLKMKEHKDPVQVELEAHNNVIEASLKVIVHLEKPLRGLVVQPHPARRVLMESVVVSYFAYRLI